MKRYFTILSFFILTTLHGQDSSKNNYSLAFDVPLLDLPYWSDAGFSLKSYQSPSMNQALSVTHGLHATNYYFNNKLWERWIPPTGKKNKIWNRVAANASAGLIDLAFTYGVVVFSIQWMHEEFHRNGLTIRGISSYDETYNRLNGGYANGSVSRVRDEDLIRLKATYPQELIRSFSAGIESEFLLLRKLQGDNFYQKAQYPNVLLNILLTKHAVDYVNQFKQPGFNSSIDSMNFHGGKISDRDFVGWDFSAWVYDLHRPDEPYAARGDHPYGPGIDRAIKSTDLSADEYAYLEKMGRLQYLNFLSPFMIGINSIKINDQTSFNFAVRHYLTSFGYDLSTDLMIKHKGKPWLFSFHGYNNKDKFFPGLEVIHPPYLITIGKKELELLPSIMVWMQPEKQRFFDQKGKAGGAVSLRTAMPLGRSVRAFVNLSGKTAGWVAGDPYLTSNFGVRSGLSFVFKD